MALISPLSLTLALTPASPTQTSKRKNGRMRKRTNKPETQESHHLRTNYMINPNGDEFTEDDPLAASMRSSEEREGMTPGRMRQAADKASHYAGDAWEQTKERASIARERTEFFLRENPVPTVLGALAIGVAIGLAIRFSSHSAEKEVESKLPLANVDLSILSLPFLWPFFKSLRRRYEDSADVVKDGVDGLKKVDVDRYVKPLRKKWRAWAN